MSAVESPIFDLFSSPQTYQTDFFDGPTQGIPVQGVSFAPSSFSTPVQSPTPTPSGNNFFSSIFNGVGSALQSAIPQFTSQLVQGGAQKLLGNNSTFKGQTGTPTTATGAASLLSNPLVIIGGVLVIGVVAYLALKD